MDILESVAKQTKEEQQKKDSQMNNENENKNIKQEKNVNQDLQFLFQALNNSFANESKSKENNQPSNVPDNHDKSEKQNMTPHQTKEYGDGDFAFNFDLNFMNPIKEQTQDKSEYKKDIPFCMMGECPLTNLFTYQLYHLVSQSSFEYKLTMMELVSRFFLEFTSHLLAEHKRQKSM